MNQVTCSHDALYTVKFRIRLIIDLFFNHDVKQLLSNEANDVLWVLNIDELQVFVGLYLANELLIALVLLHGFECFLGPVNVQFVFFKCDDEVIDNLFVAIKVVAEAVLLDQQDFEHG